MAARAENQHRYAKDYSKKKKLRKGNSGFAVNATAFLIVANNPVYICKSTIILCGYNYSFCALVNSVA